MMERRVVADHFDRFSTIVSRVHQVTGFIVVFSFAGYGTAAWLWYRERLVAAIVVGTLSYGVFRLFRPLSLRIVRAWSGMDPEYRESIAMLDREVREAGVARALEGLSRQLDEIRSAGWRSRE